MVCLYSSDEEEYAGEDDAAAAGEEGGEDLGDTASPAANVVMGGAPG